MVSHFMQPGTILETPSPGHREIIFPYPESHSDPKAGKEDKFRQWDSTEQGLQSLYIAQEQVQSKAQLVMTR